MVLFTELSPVPKGFSWLQKKKKNLAFVPQALAVDEQHLGGTLQAPKPRTKTTTTRVPIRTCVPSALAETEASV